MALRKFDVPVGAFLLCSLGSIFQPAPAMADPVGDLLTWTFGPPRRAVDVRQCELGLKDILPTCRQVEWMQSPIEKPTSAAHHPLLPRCYEIDGILPLPGNRLLVSGGGGLSLYEERQGDLERLPLPKEWPESAAKAWLLAYKSKKGPTAASPDLNILVVLDSHKGPQTTEPGRDFRILQLTLQGRRITSIEVPSQLPSSKSEYFAKYEVPHCQSRGNKCLETTRSGEQDTNYRLGMRIHEKNGNSFVDPLVELGNHPTSDAVWSTDGKRILLLQDDCRSTAKSTTNP